MTCELRATGREGERELAGHRVLLIKTKADRVLKPRSTVSQSTSSLVCTSSLDSASGEPRSASHCTSLSDNSAPLAD